MVNIYHTSFIMAWISLYEGTSFITPYKMTWENATNNCKLETPTIMFEGKKTFFPVQYNLTENTDVWVGYYLVTMVFEYLGCIEVGNMIEKAEFEYNTPGLCYSACSNSDVIGVSTSKCYCLDDDMSSNKYVNQCTSDCIGQVYLTCGNNGYMSVYAIKPNATSYPGKGDCLQVEISNRTTSVSWSRCHKRKKVLCTNNNKQVLEKIHNQGEQGRWRNAMNKCFENLTMPVSVKELEILEGNANLKPSWIRVIRSDTIFSIEDVDNTSRNNGYLEKTKAGTVLRFDKNGTAKRHVLCKHDPIMTTKAKTTFEKTSNEVQLMTSTKQAPRSTEASVPEVVILVRISVVILMILVAVCIGIVILNRRRTNASRSSGKQFSDKSTNCTLSSFVDDNLTYSISSETLYANVDDTISLTNMATSGDSLGVGDNIVHECHTIEINPNVCNAKSAVNDCDTDIGEDDEYGVVNYSIKTANILDDTYDTSATVAMKLKVKHNTEEE